ncbi:MAG: methionine adenosyltransferase [Candidatus Levybacteria bacterium]|nr:methionine adenosyltransferase [Candidatus Levybacteria bacterium]
MAEYTFTSESVCAGHPDKICDQVSDAIVDAVLTDDKNGRAAIETLVTVNKVIIAGEVRAKKKLDYKKIAREQIKRLGYTDPILQFTHKSDIEVFVHEQSPEIAKGVDTLGAGDQGMMFGYACRETKTLMPLPIMIAHALTQGIDAIREEKVLPYLRPDGKSQVTIRYKNDTPVGVTSVVLAAAHAESVKLEQVKEDLYTYVVKPVLDQFGFSVPQKDIVLNGTGVWHISGPASDTGVTGRKIVVDTYGGYAKVGGGCFSGKDPTKVDRSGAYAARFIAKHIVAEKLADRAEVRLAYFIGAKKPLMQEIQTFGTRKVSEKALRNFAEKTLDTSVAGIIKGLNLQRPIYLKTAAYGHFGRSDFPWEKVK